MTRRPSLRWLLPAIAVYALGLAAATAWDLSINQAVYTPTNLFAILMECFGWYPAFMPALLYAMLLATQPALPGLTGLWPRRVAGAFVTLAGTAVLYYASWDYMVERGLLAGPRDPIAILWLGAGVILLVMLCLAVYRCRGALREKLAFFALWGSIYMLANQAVVYPLKMLWARTRFDDMLALGSFDAFTPWYRPFGFGGSSFPSGHTANAAGIFVLLMLCDLFPKWNRRKNRVTLLCWVYVALMAFARILIGRHFLSDTLAASAILAILFFILRSLPQYQKGLRQTLENAATM